MPRSKDTRVAVADYICELLYVISKGSGTHLSLDRKTDTRIWVTVDGEEVEVSVSKVKARVPPIP